jgi:hypothetical protein
MPARGCSPACAPGGPAKKPFLLSWLTLPSGAAAASPSDASPPIYRRHHEAVRSLRVLAKGMRCRAHAADGYTPRRSPSHAAAALANRRHPRESPPPLDGSGEKGNWVRWIGGFVRIGRWVRLAGRACGERGRVGWVRYWAGWLGCFGWV